MSKLQCIPYCCGRIVTGCSFYIVQRAERLREEFLHSALLCPGLPQRWQFCRNGVAPPEEMDNRPPPEEGVLGLFSLISFFRRCPANCLALACSALFLLCKIVRGESDRGGSGLLPYECRPARRSASESESESELELELESPESSLSESRSFIVRCLDAYMSVSHAKNGK